MKRFGLIGFAEILAAAKAGPIHSYGLAEATGAERESVSRVLKQLAQCGLLHRSDWLRHRHGFDTPVYRFGPGQDAPARRTIRKGTPMPHADHKIRVDHQVQLFSRVWESMLCPTSIAGIIAESRASYSVVFALTKRMRDLGLARIGGWDEMPSGPIASLWVIGGGKDAPKPPRAQRIATRRERGRRARYLVMPQWDQVVLQLKRSGQETGRAAANSPIRQRQAGGSCSKQAA